MVEIVRKKEAIESALPTSPEQLFARLTELGISFQRYEHDPVFTVAESERLDLDIPGIHCRNLFVRDKKHVMFLIVVRNETKINLKKLQDLLGCGRLSFGSEDRLWKYLGVRPGSVCPYALINDKGNDVKVVLDQSMMEGGVQVNYHPLANHMTIGVVPDDLVKFIRSCDHDPQIMDLSLAAPD